MEPYAHLPPCARLGTTAVTLQACLLDCRQVVLGGFVQSPLRYVLCRHLAARSNRTVAGIRSTLRVLILLLITRCSVRPPVGLGALPF